jgi:thiol:disulfide interchange protein DsbD
MTSLRFFRLFAAFFLSLAASSAGAQIGTTVGNGGPGPVKALHLTVEMVTAGPQIAQGGTQTVGFVFAMEDGWHVYWRNAGFAGLPPKVKWTLPDGLKAGPLQFPAPERLTLDTAVDYGYENSVAYPVSITADPKMKADKGGKVHLLANLSWLVCKQVCIPGKADLGLDLKLVPAGTKISSDGANVGPLGAAMKSLQKPLPDNVKLTVNSSGENLALFVHTGEREPDAEFYPWEPETIVDGAQPVDVTDDGAIIHMQRSTAVKTTPKSLHGLLKLGTESTYEVDVPVVPGAVPAPKNAPPTGGAASAQGITALSAVALAFVGGMLLNLMPCVFPVLFLKALSLLQSSTEERHRVRSHGVAYTLGIVASFWLVVAVLLALRAGGNQFGWGFQLQSPGFVAVLATFLFFFALSLAGMFDFGLTLTSAGDSLTQKSGYSGSFFTGVLATVVATPCVGPFMGAAIGFALAQPAFITFLVFTSLALGLAAPYLALTLQPAWVRFLPKPGAWMELLKQITALPLFITVIWLVYIFGRLFGEAGDGILHAAWLLAGLLLIAIAAWVLGRWPARRWSTIVATLVAIGAVALPLTMGKVDANEAKWETFSAEAVQQARANGKAVFVDFTAAWCLSCQVNERLVLKTSEVQKELTSPNVVAMKADWTQYDEKITAALTAVGRSGVPTYIVYPANPTAAPDVLPEVLSKSIVLDALKRDIKK